MLKRQQCHDMVPSTRHSKFIRLRFRVFRMPAPFFLQQSNASTVFQKQTFVDGVEFLPPIPSPPTDAASGVRSRNWDIHCCPCGKHRRGASSGLVICGPDPISAAALVALARDLPQSGRGEAWDLHVVGGDIFNSSCHKTNTRHIEK